MGTAVAGAGAAGVTAGACSKTCIFMKAELTNMSQNHSTPRNERNMKFENTFSYHDHAGHMYFEEQNSKNSKAPIGRACKALACSLAMRPLASWTITASMAQRWSCAATLGTQPVSKDRQPAVPAPQKIEQCKNFCHASKTARIDTHKTKQMIQTVSFLREKNKSINPTSSGHGCGSHLHCEGRARQSRAQLGPESAQRHNEKQTFECIDTHVLTAHDVNFS